MAQYIDKIKCVKDKKGVIIPIDKITEIDSNYKTVITNKSDYSTVYELSTEQYNALLEEIEIICEKTTVPLPQHNFYVSKVDHKIHDLNHQVKTNIEAVNDNKVGRKFNIGDWVIVTTETDEHTVEIIDISYFKSGHPMYITSKGRWFGNDTKARLWNINYAKDGDILCYDDEVFIYKNFDNSIAYYACWDGKNIHLNNFYLITLEEMKTIKPATKEQRRELLKHINNAGYIWVNERKELFTLNKND